jgi:outer membrane protein assembly factor BamB
MTPRCSGVCGLVMILAAVIAGAAHAQPEPSAGLLASGTMDVRWATPPDVVIVAPPAFDAGTAYVATRDGVRALALDTGVERWQVPIVSPFTPAVGDGLVFVTSGDGVQALDVVSGAPRWRKTLPGEVAAPPYWDTGWLVLAFAGGDLAAFRAADGEMIWRTALGAVAHVAPAPGLDNLYLGLDDGRALAVSLASGRPVWERALEGRASGLTALDDQLLVGTSAGFLVSLDLRRGDVRWRFRTGGAVVGAPVADDARIYVVAYDHLLRALDRRRGQLRWRQLLPHRPADGPVLTGGAVIVPVFATELVGYDAVTGTAGLSLTSTGEVAGAMRFRIGGRPAGTRLTALGIEGRLIAFGPRVEPAPVALDALPGVAVPEPPAPSQPPPAPPPSPSLPPR